MISRHALLGQLVAAAVLPQVLPTDWKAKLRRRIGEFPFDVAVEARRLDGTMYFLHRQNERYSAASVIKIPIMLATMREIERGALSLGTLLPAHAIDIVAASDTAGHARPGDTFSIRVLLHAMITQSDNTASNILLSYLGFAKVNAVIRDVGMSSTVLARYFMHFSTTHDNLTSAHDMSTLLVRIYMGATGEDRTLASRASCRYIIDTMLEQEDGETIRAALPVGTRIANKTGELVTVRHDVAIVEPYSTNAYVVAILTHGIPDQDQAVDAIKEIAAEIHRWMGRARGLPAKPK